MVISLVYYYKAILISDINFRFNSVFNYAENIQCLNFNTRSRDIPCEGNYSFFNFVSCSLFPHCLAIYHFSNFCPSSRTFRKQHREKICTSSKARTFNTYSICSVIIPLSKIYHFVIEHITREICELLASLPKEICLLIV